VFDVIKECMKREISIGEIPPANDNPMPTKESCFRLPKDIKVYFSKSSLAAKLKSKEENKDMSASDSFVTVAEATLNYREELDKLDPNVPIFDENFYFEMCKRVKKKNSELHSLRCDMHIKLSVADKFVNDAMYFPSNLDFRGRAYPIPPNLSHLGSDLCRGLLLFYDAKPLGERGLTWLKIHLANLWGINKITFDERKQWTESNLDMVRDSAKNPIDGSRWWSKAENPV
jgi:DNA-directed RNA polymerase